jgi:hypothetical protein
MSDPNNDTEFFNQCIWQFSDKQISNSFLTFESFSTMSKWGVSPVRLKMSISQFKSQNINNIFLNQSDVYQILMKIKSFNTELSKIIQEISQDTNKVINYTIKLKKKIIISILHRTEYNGPCVRIILSDRNENYLDSEKVYLPIFDFVSLLKVLINFRDDYYHISAAVNHSMLLNKVYTVLENLNTKLSGYYSESVDLIKRKSVDHMYNISNGDSSSTAEAETTIDIIEDFSLDDIVSEIKKSTDHITNFFGILPDEDKDLVESTTESIKDKVEPDFNLDLQNQMSDFIKREAPKVNLGLEDDENPPPEIDEDLLAIGDFTETVLKNDILNLEMYITNIVNDDLPFSKFCELIQNKLGFDPLEGVSNSENRSVEYLIANYLKHTMKKSLQEQVDFPSNIPPIVFSTMNKSPQIKSLMYDLLIYFIYYTQLRNVLKDKDLNPINNKDFMCYSFKTIASPLAISLLKEIDESTLLNEIGNRLRRYKENKVFDKLNDQIYSNYSFRFNMDENSLKTEASRIYQSMCKYFDKITIPYSFKKFDFIGLRLSYEDFKNNSFDNEQIKKIISLEFNFRKNGKIKFDEMNHKGFDDIPKSVLSKFDIKEQKYDNTNLKRLIKELSGENQDLQKISLGIVDHINFSYRDLKDKHIDLTQIPVEILRAIFLWDIDRDPKISINYLHYRESVQKCSLTREMIISLLSNIQDSIDIDFVNSFIAVRN